MTVIENGLLVDRNVEVKIFPSIQHGDLLKVNSIVLHRTNSPTAASVLNSYKAGQKTGAHFLVGKDGKIHQTANLKRVCWHVGIRSEEHTSELQSQSNLVCRLLLEKKKKSVGV